MGVIKFTFLTLKNDLINSLFYLVAMIISIGVIFNIFNVIFNESIIKRSSADYQIMFLLGITILIVSIVFMLFANSYYLEGKYKEFGVITISGRSVYEISEIIMLRNFIITFLGIFMGSYLGSLVAPIVSGKAYEIGDVVNGNLKYISKEGIVMTGMIMVIQFILVLIVNTGSVYRRKIKELMINSRRAFIPDERTLKFPGAFYLIIFLAPFLLLLLPISPKDKMALAQVAVLVASFGTQGIVRYYIPQKIYKIKSKGLIVDKKKLITTSNLHTSIQRSRYLILTLVLSTAFILAVACSYEEGSVMNLMALSCFVVVVVVMGITIVYKFLVEATSRRNMFKQLYLLGYTKSDIKKIIRNEVAAFYGTIIGIALIHTLLIIVASVLCEALSMGIALSLVGIYIGTFMITAIISYICYRKTAV